MTRVLLTGFEPFDGADVNPSWEVARLVAANPPEGLLVTAARLSCVFDRAAEELQTAVREFTPDLVVCLGLWSGRSDICVERVAINIDDARTFDNAGQQPVDRPIVPDGPAAYFSTLPVKECVAAVREAGVPASVSNSAGTFVCNHVFYALMHLLATEHPTIRGGFVHIPALPEQVLDGSKPSLPAASAAHALRALLTAATHTTDLRIPEGATH
ncbi:pyroglutamyl-peptidase I [Kitasatospora cathayae]|uniref:Pyrrolidone-carboxylate peptidase n=1 Tax=Kitasatospora cathayae TaxID=3004092 RepID=A0ABY7QBG9_9ACTN|nr:pyroglutamyl-peptidase I [Kitasatospora sp. HUAS 3-15]WBP90118.1 pyroglutamyl-peptidase I [Kitasatospora sp. HUAS 3-15]